METTDLTPPTKRPVHHTEVASSVPTPPEKPVKAAKTPKEPKPKKEKAPKAEADPNAPKKPRAPRADYGFSPTAIIALVPEKAHKYRGSRLAWFQEISGFAGKPVSEFLEAKKNSEDPPRGWLRFFVQDGTIALEKPPVVEETPPTA